MTGAHESREGSLERRHAPPGEERDELVGALGAVKLLVMQPLCHPDQVPVQNGRGAHVSTSA